MKAIDFNQKKDQKLIDYNQILLKIWLKSRSSIRTRRWILNWTEIDDWNWPAWNPNRRRFVAGPLIALAYSKHINEQDFWRSNLLPRGKGNKTKMLGQISKRFATYLNVQVCCHPQSSSTVEQSHSTPEILGLNLSQAHWKLKLILQLL